MKKIWRLRGDVPVIGGEQPQIQNAKALHSCLKSNDVTRRSANGPFIHNGLVRI